MILNGWEPGKHTCSEDPNAQCAAYQPIATNCYLYDCKLYMVGEYPPCSVSFATGPLLSASKLHTNATASFAPCAGFVGSEVAVSNNNGVADSEITSQAKRALGAYPKPFAL